jgi:hypothetical protein
METGSLAGRNIWIKWRETPSESSTWRGVLQKRISTKLKNAVFWDVMPCGSAEKSIFFRSLCLLLLTSNVVPSSPILVTLKMEALGSSETSVITRATRRNIPEYRILHTHGRENLKSYTALPGWTLKRGSNVSPVKYELGFYIPEDVLHSHCRENFRSYIALTGRTL